MIFSGDRFSGHYALYTEHTGSGRDIYEGTIPPPDERGCPGDMVNYLVAHQKPEVVEEKEEPAHEKKCSEEENLEEVEDEKEYPNDYFFPLPARDVFGMQHGDLFEEATKGQHVHSCFSCYISKENHYRLSDEDAASLMMNECHFYPKKLFLHEYEHMHWKWSHSDLTQLLTQFFGKLESLSLHFRDGKDIDDHVCLHGNNSKETLELVLSCCFSSPVLTSLEILDPVRDDTATKALSSTLAAKPCPSLKKLDICYWGGDVGCLEPLARIIASHNQLTEILCACLGDGRRLTASSYSCLYTSLIGFVQRQEFSKLTLKGLVGASFQLQHLLDTFFKTPCSQPQGVHLESIYVLSACDQSVPSHMPVYSESKAPSGALEYKSLVISEHSGVTADFCEWLLSHDPLVLKTFHFNSGIVSFDEYGRLVPFKMAFPIHLLSDNTSFQTRELAIPLFNDILNEALLKLLHRQQLTHLSLQPTDQQVWEVKPCNINAITSILSLQKEQLTELTISRRGFHYTSIDLSADMERFGGALFSLRNFEIFSLCIAIVWKKDDTGYIDRLYNSWLNHGCKKMKSFQMGKFEYQFSLTDELATKLDKMGLVIDPIPS